MSEDIVKLLITSAVTLLTVYIVNIAAKKVQEKRENAQPKDRIEQIFDGYDKALKQRDLDIKDLRYNLSEARHMNLLQNEKLEEAEKRMQAALDENESLRLELSTLRSKYRLHKNDKTAPSV